ncbi:MAG TPA: glycosyltransferase family 39 protein, partial [Tepidisphaeraceae bacterium]|nr:glycosyltransferase family 39 protein [Tepidisphaeraceae bacterium]
MNAILNPHRGIFTPDSIPWSPMKLIGRILLLSLGIAAYLVMAWKVSPFENLSQTQLLGQVAAIIVAFAVACVPSLRIAMDRPVSNQPQPLLSLAVAVISIGIFISSAHFEGRFGAPLIHDELMFHTQATFLAHGRLWMPQHPLADFFQTFHILVKPVYAPMSFPGTAIFYVPAVWTGLPLWITSLLIAGGVVGLIHRIATQIFDRRIALLAALLAASSQGMRTQSIEIFPYLPAVLLELAMLWAWLRWHQSPKPRWAFLAGIFAGWALITRPLDALCFIIPLAIAVIWRLPRLPARKRFTTAALAIAATLPFIS